MWSERRIIEDRENRPCRRLKRNSLFGVPYLAYLFSFNGSKVTYDSAKSNQKGENPTDEPGEVRSSEISKAASADSGAGAPDFSFALGFTASLTCQRCRKLLPGASAFRRRCGQWLRFALVPWRHLLDLAACVLTAGLVMVALAAAVVRFG
jgi:hypothetical protein